MAKDIETKIEENQSAVNRVRSKLDIKTESYDVGRDDHAHAKDLIRRSGLVLAPTLGKYVGSGVFHIYESTGEKGREIQVVTFAPFDKAVNEVQAGLALDELRRKLMAAYGRTPTGGR